FSRALHNSVYSFAAILVTLLLALGLGGVLAAGVTRRWGERPLPPLAALLTAAALAVAVSPFVFDRLTDGLRLFASGEGWVGYVSATFWCAAAVMLVPGILLGSVFPYTLRLAGHHDGGAGATIGALAAANTVGAVAGSLAAGFLALPALGLWGAIRAVALLYLATAALTAAAGRHRALAVAPLAGAVLLFTALDPTRLSPIHLAPGETLRRLRETAAGTVAVTERDGVLALTLDGHYTVGASGAVYNDRRQAELPMLLTPRPREVFLIGLGTGITAGGALFQPIDHLTVAELVPGVADAARDEFAPYVNQLFSDPRARIVVGDGRTVLRASPGPYDVIVGDLFVPWDRGAGNLYTREHFTSVRDRLAEDGVFAQWLPLYQLSWRDFAVIAHTMLTVFPQVTVWRGDFSADEPAVGLVGQRVARPLDLDVVVENVRRRPGAASYPAEKARALALLFYAGNLSAAPQLVAEAPINTDDRPVIEYQSPATPMEVVHGTADWLTGAALNRFWSELAAAVPPARDPFLADVPADERQRVDGGRLLHAANILRAAGRDGEARQAREEFRALVPAEVADAFQ
ncbi:MAG TPA: fused MFS/spermidine synthase, partial [Candidatus Dormibacteraeota bacterium]|nr:fused MFS/spermidine synthase [Candidatus Dormibacteraeota bacterium]